MGGENLLNELLKFLSCRLVALTFDFLRQFVDRDQVVLVQLDRFAQFFDRGRRVAATTFQ